METDQKTEQGAAQKHINIFINDERFEPSAASMTGHAILTLGAIPEGNQLFLEVPGPEDDRQIGPNEEVALKSGMRFYDVPVGNFG